MNETQQLIDRIAWFDLIDRLDARLGGLWYVHWREVWRKHGASDLLSRFIVTMANRNSYEFRFLRHAGWSGLQVERLLRYSGIRIFGRWFTEDVLIFRMMNRQARRAEYVMQRAGIPLVSVPVDV